MSKIKYKGTGSYDFYSDLWIDVIKRGQDEFIAMDIHDGRPACNTVHIPNLLAIKRLRDILDILINKNKEYYKYVGE